MITNVYQCIYILSFIMMTTTTKHGNEDDNDDWDQHQAQEKEAYNDDEQHVMVRPTRLELTLVGAFNTSNTLLNHLML